VVLGGGGAKVFIDPNIVSLSPSPTGRSRLHPNRKGETIKSLGSGGTIVARQKLKGIDGRAHQEWSMRLNLTQHGETYQVQTQ